MPDLSRKYVMHDCDPGPDDALALMISLSCPQWEVVAITTVGGNVGVDQCTYNARRIAALCRAELPVYKGSEGAIKRDIDTLETIFTQSGLPGAEEITDLGLTIIPDMPAVDFLAKELSEKQNKLYIVCATGPLTNIARALQKNPAAVHNIEHLVVMGGCLYPEPVRGEMGNYDIKDIGIKAEYNFAMDPEAVQIVLQSGIKNISIIGLNITRKILFNSYWRERFSQIDNEVALAAARILNSTSESHVRDLGHLRQTPDDPVRAVHDAIAVIYMSDPDLFETKDVYLKVLSDPAPGLCEISEEPLPGHGFSVYPVRAVCDADTNAVFEKICDALGRYSYYSNDPLQKVMHV